MRRSLTILKSLAPSLCLKVVLTLLANPLLILPTLRATIQSIRITEQHFQAHSKGAANAFKHALWNVLIILKTKRFLSEQKAEKWAEKITNLHESCVQNDEMNLLMDLHNNRVGRQLFQLGKANGYKTVEDFTNLVSTKSKSAMLVNYPKFFANYPYDLVYIK